MMTRVHDGAVVLRPADAARRWRWATQFLHTLGTFGYPYHLMCGCLWCLVCMGPPLTVELFCIPVYVALLARLPFVWRGLRDGLSNPAMLALVAWWMVALVTGVQRAGTAEAQDALWHELSYIRWIGLFAALYALLDARRMLIGCLCVGFAGATLAQVVELVALREGMVLFSHPPAPDPLARISGWWHQPAVGGVMLVAALGLHVGPALFGHGWRRWVGCGGAVWAGVGIILTGARGSLVAAGVLVGGMVMMAVLWHGRAVVRGGMRGAERGGAAGAVGMGVLALAACGVLVASPMSARLHDRIEQAGAQWTSATRAQSYDSDVGARVVAARAAVDGFGEHPLTGIGPGAFLAHTRTYAARERLDIAGWRVDKLRTAHNTYLHALATTGGLGLLLLLAALAGGVWCASVEVRARGVAALGTYASGPLVALLGLAIVAMFETIYLNMSSAALATTLLALSGLTRVGADGRG